MNTYKLAKSSDGIESLCKVTEDQTIWWIPFDPDNTDYQEYLKWVAEGNQPLPADE